MKSMRSLLAAIFWPLWLIFTGGWGMASSVPPDPLLLSLSFSLFSRKKVKDPRYLVQQFQCKEIDSILFVTRQGNCVHSVNQFHCNINQTYSDKPAFSVAHPKGVGQEGHSFGPEKKNHKVGVEKNKLISHHLIILKNISRKCYLI